MASRHQAQNRSVDASTQRAAASYSSQLISSHEPGNRKLNELNSLLQSPLQGSLRKWAFPRRG